MSDILLPPPTFRCARIFCTTWLFCCYTELLLGSATNSCFMLFCSPSPKHRFRSICPVQQRFCSTCLEPADNVVCYASVRWVIKSLPGLTVQVYFQQCTSAAPVSYTMRANSWRLPAPLVGARSSNETLSLRTVPGSTNIWAQSTENPESTSTRPNSNRFCFTSAATLTRNRGSSGGYPDQNMRAALARYLSGRASHRNCARLVGLA